jgi:hypothetical protein
VAATRARCPWPTTSRREASCRSAGRGPRLWYRPPMARCEGLISRVATTTGAVEGPAGRRVTNQLDEGGAACGCSKRVSAPVGVAGAGPLPEISARHPPLGYSARPICHRRGRAGHGRRCSGVRRAVAAPTSVNDTCATENAVGLIKLPASLPWLSPFSGGGAPDIRSYDRPGPTSTAGQQPESRRR